MHDSFERLRSLIHDADSDTRGMVAVSLARIADPEATALLIELLEDSDERVVCAALRSLGERNDKQATAALINCMHSNNSEVVCGAIAALALLEQPSAFAPIVAALFDVHDDVRRNAAAAIGRLGDKRALEPLYEILKDQQAKVRANAALSLAMLFDEASVPKLKTLLEHESDEDVRSNAVIALGACDQKNNQAALDYLLDACEPDKVRVAGALALASRGEAGLFTDEAFVRRAVHSVLSQEITPREVRAACLWSLGRFSYDEATVQILIAALDDSYRWVILYAVESLALLKASQADSALRACQVANKNDEEIVKSIDCALQEIQLP